MGTSSTGKESINEANKVRTKNLVKTQTWRAATIKSLKVIPAAVLIRRVASLIQENDRDKGVLSLS